MGWGGVLFLLFVLGGVGVCVVLLVLWLLCRLCGVLLGGGLGSSVRWFGVGFVG